MSPLIITRWEADGARRYDVKLSSEATTDTVQNGFEVGRENERIIRSGFLICNIASPQLLYVPGGGT
jgi:hypothetical protein